MAAPNSGSSRGHFHLFIRLPVGNADVFGRAVVSFGRGSGADGFDGRVFCELLAGAKICEQVGMEFTGGGRNFGNCADQDWDAAPAEELAVCAYCVVRGGSVFPSVVVAGIAEVEERRR